MIEIIFDRNLDDSFLNEKRPVAAINQHAEDWHGYRKIAKKLLETYKNDRIVIIRTIGKKVSINWLAVALFVESCLFQSRTEAFVFKTKNYEETVVSYKPFVALTIGIKYALRLYHEDFKSMYKDIAGLSYLGLSIKEDYLRNKLIVKLERGGKTVKMQAVTTEETLAVIGTIKSLALSSANVSVEGEFDMADVSSAVDIDKVIDEIAERTSVLSGGL